MVAALALNQREFKISVYEQARELHELGAGVTITPRALSDGPESQIGEDSQGLASVRVCGTDSLERGNDANSLLDGLT
jgi:hypothetical protein